MKETNVLPWVEVNEMMDDEYRQVVVGDALSHYPKASAELKRFALDVLKKAVHVNGFRSFESIPTQLAKRQVAKEFKVNDLLATAVICLWAEKQHELIESLAKAAQEANVPLKETWGWQEARDGFVQSEEASALDQLASSLSAQKEKPESDHFILAGLWLSNRVVVE